MKMAARLRQRPEEFLWAKCCHNSLPSANGVVLPARPRIINASSN